MSKRCIRAREHVSLFSDGELSEFERALLTAHLARCESCRRFQADVSAMTERLRAAPLEPLTQPITLPRRRPAVAARALQAVAAAAAVVAVGFGAVTGLVDSAGPRTVGIKQIGSGLEPGGNDRLIRAVRVRDMLPPPVPPRQGFRIGPAA
ncbi:MAG: zf-HC2 domain-containing protein [Gaiellaceae bacterium]